MIEDQSNNRIAELEKWLQWCLDNCDDSPEWNFGKEATETMQKLLRGEDIDKSDK